MIRDRVTFGTSGWPFTLADPAAVDYDPARFPGTFKALEQVLVLPWNERYTDEHVMSPTLRTRSATPPASCARSAPLGIVLVGAWSDCARHATAIAASPHVAVRAVVDPCWERAVELPPEAGVPAYSDIGQLPVALDAAAAVVCNAAGHPRAVGSGATRARLARALREAVCDHQRRRAAHA